MAAVGDIYVVKMFQSLFLQQCLNVFYYELLSVGTPPGAEALFLAFDEDVLSDWKNCVINSIAVDTLEVFKIAEPSDYHSGTPTNGTGTRLPTGNLRSPSWVSFSYKSNRAGAGTRSSFKRFAGLAEEDCNANSLDPTFLALGPVLSLQSVMGQNIWSGTGAVFKPVQVKSGWVLGLPPVKNFDITTWQIPTLSSQVSRKP